MFILYESIIGGWISEKDTFEICRSVLQCINFFYFSFKKKIKFGVRGTKVVISATKVDRLFAAWTNTHQITLNHLTFYFWGILWMSFLDLVYHDHDHVIEFAALSFETVWLNALRSMHAWFLSPPYLGLYSSFYSLYVNHILLYVKENHGGWDY